MVVVLGLIALGLLIALFGFVERSTRPLRIGLTVACGAVLGLVVFIAVFATNENPISGDLQLVRSQQNGMRVLFVGNSLTAEHSIPSLVRSLAAHDRGAQRIFVVQYARGGGTLSRAADDDALKQLLEGERWDRVVLQENSYDASLPDRSRTAMRPAVETLVRGARSAGASPFLYMTWGFKDGDGAHWRGDSFQWMQHRLAQAYISAGRAATAPVAPVGYAWQESLGRKQPVVLWAPDGMHPTLAGSYLAACVLYGSITGRDSTGSRFAGGLPPSEARFLRSVGTYAVRHWGP